MIKKTAYPSEENLCLGWLAQWFIPFIENKVFILIINKTDLEYIHILKVSFINDTQGQFY